MSLKDIVPFPAAFDNPFLDKKQHNSLQCLAGKWLALTLKHGYKNCNCWKALSFVNNTRLFIAIARPLTAAIALVSVTKLICSQRLLQNRLATSNELFYRQNTQPRFNQPKKSYLASSLKLIKF